MHYIVLGRTLQNPTSTVFTFMWRVCVAKSFCRCFTFLWRALRTLHNLSIAGFELPSPTHFFDQTLVSCIKMRDNRLLCDRQKGKSKILFNLYISLAR